MGAYRALFFLLFSYFSFNALVVRAQILPKGEVEALKEIAAKLKIPATLWNFKANPCTQWPKEDEGLFFHNITCAPITETVANATTNTTTNITSWHVVAIEIKGANLSGVLPEELSKLKFLSYIDISRNFINGSIPAANWTSLPLKYLNILGNRISGTIPPEISRIRTLEVLFLESNLLEGALPRSLGNLNNLTRLLVSCNNFSGELPETLGNLKNLTDVRLDGNQISGKIPSFIGNWTKLERFDVQGTLMQGPFPSEFSLLESLKELRFSDLHNPASSFPSLEKMQKIKQLVLRNCSISGSIPGSIGELTKLDTLDLSFNDLTGEIPGNLGTLVKLNNLYLTNNKLSGAIPDWIQRSRKNIDISYNTFTDLSSAPSNCEQESRNYVASFSSTTSDSIASCLRKDLPCSGTAKNFEFFINCGGEGVNVGGKEYEPDISPDGKSKYYISPTQKWAYSSTGNFIGGSDVPYIVRKASALTMPNADLYTSARLSPLSLKYYGLCLQPGNYTVTLHFAEIIFTSGPTFWSLGRRLFDVSIQGQKVLRDFNIVEAANGTRKVVMKNFTAVVKGSTLEIHFSWSGKGTNSLPDRGFYGPLISAISVTPNFTPHVFNDAKKFPVGAIIGIAAGSAVFVIFLVILWFFLRRKPNENDGFSDLQLPTGGFTLKQIKAATKNFKPTNKIGEGGFGPVYKGILPDGSMIAVKQLSSKSKQGNREFVNEIGMISGLQHPNLVKLFGCCIEGNQLLLIYEYMENNSLARALFGPEGAKLELYWSRRRKICLEIAKGLAYLHEESRLKMVHRDIKSTNVLLDKDLNAKISDFGLAKLKEDKETHMSTRIAGTMGYIAPEYAMRGHLTDKADVYSFGVVTLEIVSGKSNTKNLHKEGICFLLDWAHELQEKGNLLDLVDPAIGDNFNSEEAQQMLNLALACTDPSPSVRPSMSSVVFMLESHTHIQIENKETRYVPADILSYKDEDLSLDGPWMEPRSTPSSSMLTMHSATSASLA